MNGDKAYDGNIENLIILLRIDVVKYFTYQAS